MQAVALLKDRGYEHVEHYPGGIAEWKEHRPLAVKGQGRSAILLSAPTRPHRRSARIRMRHLLEKLDETSFGALFGLWLAMVVGCGVLFWLLALAGTPCLKQGGVFVQAGLWDLCAAIYFSFVAATSIGFGDVIPVGIARPIAIIEGATALLLFGCVISKLVGQRQEQMLGEIHQLTFDERFGRLRTNLHMVLSELQSLLHEGAFGSHANPLSCQRLLARLESAAMVFIGDLQAIHDLLYRPHRVPEEASLEGLLANLVAILSEFQRLLHEFPQKETYSPLLLRSLQRIRQLSGEICGECMPTEYTPGLKLWMDRVHSLSEELGRLPSSPS